MQQISITADFSKITGRIKPMHSVNNGPAGSRGSGNFKLFSEAGFPYARTHDASFCPAYGGAHTVDVIAIFKDFDADENDPASYDFALTDEYMENIMSTGTKVFYRLGNKIEHESKRYGSIPPKNFEKWARICEHIIRHLNYGWADGHEYGIEYFEIWNEPDLHPNCWDGTNEEFYPLYDITARHLKACFPELKIGGPTVTSVYSGFLDGFFKYITRDGVSPAPLDFFSYHCYSREPEAYGAAARAARELLDRWGYKDSEIILNEWNYVKNWAPAEDVVYSYRVIRSLKGSAFVASSVIDAQHSPMDHFMYYDARYGTNWNGLFDIIDFSPLKPYYSLYAFNELYKAGSEVSCESDCKYVRAAAAVNETSDEAYILLSYYMDEENYDGGKNHEKTLSLRLDWTGFSDSEKGVSVEYCVIDKDHSLEAVSGETFFGEKGAHIMPLQLYTTVLVRIRKN